MWLTLTDMAFGAAIGGMALAGLTAGANARHRRASRSTARELFEIRRRLSESQRLAELGSWELDLRTGALAWSDEVFRIFEIGPRDFGASYDAFLALVHPDDRERVNHVYRFSVEARAPYDLVHRLRMADGRIKTVRERGITHYDPATGRPVRSIGTVQDVSRIAGSPRPYEREQDRADGRPNNEPLPVSGVREPFPPARSRNGATDDLGAFATDIMERRRIESELAALNQDLHRQIGRLRESEDRFAKLFRSNPIAVGLRRIRDDVMLDVNPAFEVLVGRARDELVGRPMNDLNLYHVAHERLQLLERLARGERVSNFEVRFRTETGEPRTLLMTVETLLIGGEPCGLASLVDITERRRTENERKVLEAQLHEARKMEALGAFASGIVHDFNNILTVVSGNIEVALRETRKDAAIRRSLELVQLASRRGVDLVRRISAFARGQRTAMSLVDPAAAVKDACALLQPSIGSTVAFDLDIETRLPRVLSDAGQIHQILANLLTNAVQALGTGGGQITVQLRARHLRQPVTGRLATILPGEYVVLSVADTGPGIDTLMQSRIFEPFFTTKPPSLGTGLGLAVVEGIVSSHGGHITLESAPGAGSVFHVWLPAAAEPEGPTADPPRPSGARSQSASRHILHVDDDTAFAEHIGARLRDHGFSVTTLFSAHEGLEYVRASGDCIDLLITDYRMPDLSGVGLARQTALLRPALPILILTGAADEELERTGNSSPTLAVLSKSQGIEALLDSLRRLLD